MDIGPISLFPLPLSSFCVLKCDKWTRLTPDPSCFPKKLLQMCLSRLPGPSEHRGVAPHRHGCHPHHPLPEQAQRGMRGRRQESAAEADKTTASLGLPVETSVSPLVSLRRREATELGHGHPEVAVLWEIAEFAVGNGCQDLHGSFYRWGATGDAFSRSPPSLPPSLPSPQTTKLQIHGQCWFFIKC